MNTKTQEKKNSTNIIQEIFAKADILLFKERKYFEAESLYRQIIKLERESQEKNNRNLIDALNSIGYCIKFRAQLIDLLEDNDVSNTYKGDTFNLIGPQKIGLFSYLVQIYQEALVYDPDDVEANFNLAGIYLQKNRLSESLQYFKNSVKKDMFDGPFHEIKQLFQNQFIKAYFNIGLIQDQNGNILEALEYYDRAYQKIFESTQIDQNVQKFSDPSEQPIFLKICMNLSANLEKCGQYERAIQVLNQLKNKKVFKSELSKINNNLGVLLHREGNDNSSKETFQKALAELDQQSNQQTVQQKMVHDFILKFNISIVEMQNNKLQESLHHFDDALKILNMFGNAEILISQQPIATHKLNIYVNKALIYQVLMNFNESLKYVNLALKIAVNNEKLLEIKKENEKKIQQQQAKKQSLQKIIENHPNAESMSNQHSRKTSNVNQTDASKQIDGEGTNEEANLLIVEQKIDNINIHVELQGIELTKEEELNTQDRVLGHLKDQDQQNTNAFNSIGQNLKDQRGRQNQTMGNSLRDPSPDFLLVQSPEKIKLQQSIAYEWKNWSQIQCNQIILQNEHLLGQQTKQDDGQELKNQILWAKFRLGEIYQNNLQYDQAIETYQNVLNSPLKNNELFMKEKLLMRLADCCYRCEKIDIGLGYLERLQKDILPKRIYTIFLLRGKYKDLQRLFSEAADQYQQAFKIYQEDFNEEKIDQNILGNIQFRLGWALIRSRKNIDQGIDIMKKADINLLNNSDLKFKIAQILFQEKQDVKLALEYNTKSLEIDSENVDALMLQGKLFIKEKQGQEAIDILEKSLQLQIKNSKQRPSPSTFFYLGQAFEIQKEYKKCLQNYKMCLQFDQNHFGACIHLANLLANLAEGQRAVKYFKHALRIDPNSVNANFGMAKALQQYSEDKEAPIPHFLKAIEKDSQHFKAHTQLGILYLDREEFEKSANHLKCALQINKQFPLALLSMGNLLFETNHPENAIKYHKHALKYNPKELQALIGLGNAYYDMQQPKESIKFYKNAIEIDDGLSDVHYNLGNALYLIESIDDAIMHYEQAIKLNPKKPESYYNLGNALCVKNEYQNAINSYQNALELDSNNAPALYNLGNALYMMNKYEEAVVSYQKALKINEKSPECHFNLASAFNDLKNYKQALQHYHTAIELDEENVDAYVCIGNIYEILKKPDKAKFYYKQAQQIQPDNPKVIEALEKIK